MIKRTDYFPLCFGLFDVRKFFTVKKQVSMCNYFILSKNSASVKYPFLMNKVNGLRISIYLEGHVNPHRLSQANAKD